MHTRPKQENGPLLPLHLSPERELAYRRAARVYIFLLAVVTLCVWSIGMEHLVGSRWVSRTIYNVVDLVATFGFLPFILSSPILFFVMVLDLSRRHREWLYLGLCDLALFVLLFCSAIVASTM